MKLFISRSWNKSKSKFALVSDWVWNEIYLRIRWANKFLIMGDYGIWYWPKAHPLIGAPPAAANWCCAPAGDWWPCWWCVFCWWKCRVTPGMAPLELCVWKQNEHNFNWLETPLLRAEFSTTTRSLNLKRRFKPSKLLCWIEKIVFMHSVDSATVSVI